MEHSRRNRVDGLSLLSFVGRTSKWQLPRGFWRTFHCWLVEQRWKMRTRDMKQAVEDKVCASTEQKQLQKQPSGSTSRFSSRSTSRFLIRFSIRSSSVQIYSKGVLGKLGAEHLLKGAGTSTSTSRSVRL